MIYKIDTTEQVLVGQRYVEYVHDFLGRGLQGGAANKSIGNSRWWGNGHLQGIVALVSLGLFGGKLVFGQGQGACVGLEGGGECGEGLSREIGLFLVFDQRWLYGVATGIFGDAVRSS